MATRKTARSQAKRSIKTGVGDGSEHRIAPGGDYSARRDSPSFQQIQLRAYEIFVARGGTHGDDLSDWLEAEQELSKSSRPRSD